MGRVLLARDPNLDRDVAIKLLREDLKLAPEERRALFDRMQQEAKASARLAHPNIVALYDMGEEPGLGLFLVFEFVEGPTLEDRIQKGPVGVEAAAELARELGRALRTAHAAGVLHRDIKPANIILAQSGAKIADFGIARIPGSTLTLSGGVLGTPAYSAPESILHGKFSPASDQFSLAATLYEAISGRRAFPGEDSVTVSNRITETEPAPIAELAGVDRHVDAALARGMHKHPEARFPNAEDLGEALAEALLYKPRAKMATLPDERRSREREHRASRRDLTILCLGIVLGASLMASVFLLWPSPAGQNAGPTPAGSAVRGSFVEADAGAPASAPTRP